MNSAAVLKSAIFVCGIGNGKCLPSCDITNASVSDDNNVVLPEFDVPLINNFTAIIYPLKCEFSCR